MLRNLIFIIVPLVVLLYSFESLFFRVEYDYGLDKTSQLIDESYNKSSSANQRIQYHKGVFTTIQYLDQVLTELKLDKIPEDGKLDKTIDKLERIILLQKIYIGINLFIVFLCISTIISSLNQAWFSITLGRIVHTIAIIYGLIYLIKGAVMINLKDYQFGTLLTVGNLALIVLTIMGLRYYYKMKKSDQIEFRSLYLASFNTEDAGSVRTIAKKTNVLKILFHFSIIIFFGVLIGNLVYIPLFNLQKHYSAQFGILLLSMLIVMCLIYITNYYTINREENIPFWKNLIVSASFLQFRFLKNLSFLFFSITGIVVFVLILFSILILNASILTKQFQMIEKAINL